jgi:hypothetical protein
LELERIEQELRAAGTCRTQYISTYVEHIDIHSCKYAYTCAGGAIAVRWRMWLLRPDCTGAFYAARSYCSMRFVVCVLGASCERDVLSSQRPW